MQSLRKVVVALPFSTEFDDLRATVTAAVRRSFAGRIPEIEIVGFQQSERTEEWCRRHIGVGSLLIVETTKRGPFYALGYADALSCPRLILASAERGHPVGYEGNVIVYDAGQLQRLHDQLVLALNAADRSPNDFIAESRSTVVHDKRSRAFISYAHVDRQCVERLRVHLRHLERTQRLDVWDDSRIVAGSDWKQSIQTSLESAKIAILLVSADFLASDFVTSNELPQILQRAESHGTLVLPVIIRPSRFSREKELSRFQAINDPRRPLLMLSSIEQDELYERIAERIELELGVLPGDA